MAAWGIDGGGPKGEQAISDLVAYLESIQLGDDGANQQVDDDVKALEGDARRTRSTTSQDDLAAARRSSPRPTTRERPRRPRQTSIEAAEQALANSRTWLDTVVDARARASCSST